MIEHAEVSLYSTANSAASPNVVLSDRQLESSDLNPDSTDGLVLSADKDRWGYGVGCRPPSLSTCQVSLGLVASTKKGSLRAEI